MSLHFRSDRRDAVSPRFIGFAFLLSLGITIGCESSDSITAYEIPTKTPAELSVGKDRMLAAMVPKGKQVWFFKVTGPENAIQLIEETYRDFVQNIEIEESPNLSELPDGWRRGAEKPMRTASIDVDTPDKQLDISVSQLSRQEDWDGFVAMNVNRWRGQLGLEASQEKWAGGEPFDAAAADGPSVWVDLTADPSAQPSSSAMAPPFANRPPPTAGPSSPAASSPAASSPAASAANGGNAEQAESPLTFDVPEGWRPGRMTSMRLAAFDSGPEDKPGTLTVIAAGGDLRGNVARWIGQIRSDVPDEVVDKALADAQKIVVNELDSQRFLLKGASPDEGDWIDVTIVPLSGGASLFVKMQGPAKVVEGQQENIKSFLESLKLKN